MEPDTKNAEGSPTQRPSERRREAIFIALRKCIIDKGYATTTLADIAREAGMSPSHLLYYFSDKVDILSQYFESVSSRITDRLAQIRAEPHSQQIDLLARLFFSGKGLSKSDIGFMLECFGVAVHDAVLKRQKADLDRYCKDYLRELFEALGGSRTDPVYAAEVAYALLVGLRTAVYFDKDLTIDEAQQIFRTEMTALAESPTVRSDKVRQRIRHSTDPRPA